MLKVATRGRILFGSTALLVLATGATVAKSPAEFTVHEWGTFLAMSGSDGVTLDGMYHEEHALPGFVHARSKDELHVPAVSVKGETPVIYFYSDIERDLDVRVRFPRGLWTQWYPQAQYNGPTTAQAGSPPQLRNGHISWRVRITPPTAGVTRALPTTPQGSLWRFARDVDSAYVRPTDRSNASRSEVERFIFYRGLGEANLPLKMSADGNGTLSYDPGERQPLRHLFVIRVEHGRGAYRYLPSLAPGQTLSDATPAMTAALPEAEFAGTISDDLARRLTEAGLYPKEARAMANTWRHSYFGTDGIRVLFVMPQEWTDRFIPMEITPKPARLVRVMVGRLELLTAEREQAAAQAIRDLASAETDVRERAYAFLRDQGRYLEPVLRRTLKTTEDSNVRKLCNRLLLSDFVTELHAALNTEGGEDRMQNELDTRAQLASLLHDVGLSAQARQEAERILPDLNSEEAPLISSASFRQYARIHARTMEGLGDDAGAANWYGQFVKFGSQSNRCGGCHATQGPTGLGWYREWWAGRKFAEYASRAGGCDAAITRAETALKAAPNDTATRMMLAYLYEHKGETAKSAQIWARLDPQLSNGSARLADRTTK